MNAELDIWDDMPEEQKRYLRNYGWNFSKKACKCAVEKMKSKGRKVDFVEKDRIMETMKKHGIGLDYDNGYNAVYAYHMTFSDCWGESIEDELHLCKHVKCLIDDEDNKGGNLFRKWYSDCVANGIVVNWDDIID